MLLCFCFCFLKQLFTWNIQKGYYIYMKLQLGCRISNPSWKWKILQEKQWPVEPIQPSAELELRVALQQNYQDKLPMSFTYANKVSQQQYMQDASNRCRMPKLQSSSCPQSPDQEAQNRWCLVLPSRGPVQHLCFKDRLLYKLRVWDMPEAPQIGSHLSLLPQRTGKTIKSFA